MATELLHLHTETQLERLFASEQNRIQISGGVSTAGLAMLLSQSYSKEINRLPHVVVASSTEEAERFAAQLSFFDPLRRAVVLGGFDVSPYSGLYPNSQFTSQRLRFLNFARHAKPGEIFVAPISALLQRTLPVDVFVNNSRAFSVGDEIPDNFADFLFSRGYRSAPLVEDRGQFSVRGGIIDIYSSAHELPVRIELFGDQIESLRFFSPISQLSTEECQQFVLTPGKEYLFSDDRHEGLLKSIRTSLEGRPLDSSEAEEMLRSLVLKLDFPGIDFLLPYFFDSLASPLEYFPGPCNMWFLDPSEVARAADEFDAQLKSDFQSSQSQLIRPPLADLYSSFDKLPTPKGSRQIDVTNLEYLDSSGDSGPRAEFKISLVTEFVQSLQARTLGSPDWADYLRQKVHQWQADGYRIFISARGQSAAERLGALLAKADVLSTTVDDRSYLWDTWLHEQGSTKHLVHIIPRNLGESFRIPEEQLIFLQDDDFFGRRRRSSAASSSEEFSKNAKRLSFGDLKPGDLVVHVKHGIGVYDGLKTMSIGGVESEYIQVGYKDKDKLYLPVYRVGQLQKYSSASASAPLDKLGGHGWEKTKIKVKAHLKDIASELLALYAKRAEMHRPSFAWKDEEVLLFENGFPYEETNDQLRAINDISKDLRGDRPMDRLICGDVGFGKTEVAMRAAFFAIQARHQVAVLAPTTVLTFQHMETFKKRFQGWPVDIRVLNRFVSAADARKTIQDLKDGKVDLVIGTHKLLNNSITYKDLGLLIVDEEQKFGVTHKEKIKKMRTSVDTLTLSATPIPRTLNMSLVGIRDLSIINTAPVDRLPTRTFITKFDPETVRKACESEIARGGQVYFIHNRIQSIYGIADEIRTLMPKARIRVAHGQMDEDELEQAMLAFFHHEIDILVCTAIVESGMDVPRANTMFIDDAHMFGLSQLYQLRGRVGRSKTRAYCYLLMPRGKKLDQEQQERLKIIQDNSALGSGLKIAQYDLELRGAGNILGDDQSGHVNSVGYELYMDLLHEALAQAKGEPLEDQDLDPEINLRVPAMIPDSYIKDIRIRLGYYKALADISSTEDLDRIEEELKDQFGPLPEPTINLMGLMLIRRQCKELGVRDVSAGLKTISLVFTEKTRLKPETVIKLATRENKKYSITPDNRFNIRLNNITWSAVYEELEQLLKLI